MGSWGKLNGGQTRLELVDNDADGNGVEDGNNMDAFLGHCGLDPITVYISMQ